MILHFFQQAFLVIAMCLAVLVALAIWILIAYICWFSLQKRQQVTRMVTLANNSNVQTVFHLQTDLGDLKKKIRTIWLLGNQSLKPKKVEQISFLEEIRPQKTVAKPKPDKHGGSKGEVAEVKEKTEEKYNFFRSIASLVANISASLATLLPDSLNKPFKSLAESIRKSQQSASQALAKPRDIARTGEKLKSNVKQLDSTISNKQHPPVKPGGKQPDTGTTMQVELPEKQFKRTVTFHQVIETQMFAPAESATYQFILRPANPLGKLAGTFTISSQQINNDDFPANEILKAQTLSGDFATPALRFIHIILPLLVCLGVLVLNVLWATALIHWLTHLLAAV